MGVGEEGRRRGGEEEEERRGGGEDVRERSPLHEVGEGGWGGGMRRRRWRPTETGRETSGFETSGFEDLEAPQSGVPW